MLDSAKLPLPDGYIDIPNGKIAAIQTLLEMRARPASRPDPPHVRASLRHVRPVDADWYLALYHCVGDDYLWYSRLTLSHEELAALFDDPNYDVYAVEQDGRDEGFLELDFRVPGDCEIRYFGLTAALIGTGAGRWLMNRAIEMAWSRPIKRFWVHTCTIDHPSALAFYRRSGFVPYERKLELADDPRIAGLISIDAAPQVPILSARRAPHLAE
jgi:GNAT superfamily N-acetyltransferase